MIRKILIISFAVLMLGFATQKAQAAYSQGAAIGASFYGGLNSSGLLATFHIPNVPLILGAAVSFGYGGWFGINVLADWWTFQTKIGSINNQVPVHFYFGPGVDLGVGFGRDYFSVDLGLRVPFGFSFIIKQKWELFIELAPGIRILSTAASRPLFPGYVFGFSSQLGFRYWF